MHDDDALRLVTAAAGTDRLVFGTNFAGWDAGAPEHGGEMSGVLSRNARRLLRLDRSRG